MSKHTNEPWATEYRERPDGMFAQEIFDEDGETIATMAWYPVKVDIGTATNREDNARRIVACVNACRGLATDDLEQTGLASAFGYQLIEADLQRDALKAALKRIAEYPETSQQELGIEAIKAIARMAIERVEGVMNEL